MSLINEETMNEKSRNLRPAQNLEEVHGNFLKEPLLDRDEFEAFYRDEINNLRGEDRIKRLRLGLTRDFHGIFFKALLAGHPGVGKSTELTKLLFSVEDKFYVFRFNIASELDPGNFQPFDILLLIMTEIAKRTSTLLEEAHSPQTLNPNILKEIWQWFDQEKSIWEETSQINGSIEAGAGINGESLWAKMLGLFTQIRGELRYASNRKKEFVEYRFRQLSSLSALANRLLDECNRLLWENFRKEWLIIGEDFDKPRISPDRVEDFFITYSAILIELNVHIIMTIPIALAYSEKASSLPVTPDRLFCLPNTPVFDENHKPHRKGRSAIQSILEARINLSLIEKRQISRLIVASGGNLRDLFSLVSQSVDYALIREAKIISKEDVTKSINSLRLQYKRRLGESPYDKIPITFDEKAKRLIQIYHSERETEIADPVLHSLLRACAVQEFNGEGWFGVHPLVVDLLKTFGRLKPDETGRVPGGTE